MGAFNDYIGIKLGIKRGSGYPNVVGHWSKKPIVHELVIVIKIYEKIRGNIKRFSLIMANKCTNQVWQLL